MAAEGRKSVNEILAGLHEQGTKSPGTTSDDKAPANRSIAARAENQAGWSGSHVEALRQQAGEVIRVLDESVVKPSRHLNAAADAAAEERPPDLIPSSFRDQSSSLRK